jgi:cytochrome c oxidase subunit II
MNWLLEPGFSTYSADIDRLYYIILFITGVVFVLTEFLLVYFLIKYRKREGQPAAYTHGSTKAEIIWTGIPFVIVVALAFMSMGVWERIKDPRVFPEDGYEISVSSRQFEWETRYPGADGQLGTADDFTLLNLMHVPANRPVVVHLESEDVIHSFFIPEFRLKQDAVPGMTIPIWFEATQAGEYTLGCAELCGIGHYRMSGRVIAQSAAEFSAWESQQIAAHEAARAGTLASTLPASGADAAQDF